MTPPPASFLSHRGLQTPGGGGGVRVSLTGPMPSFDAVSVVVVQNTHHYPEVLQVLELAEVFLQLWVNGLVLHLGILQEGPKLLQSVQLTWMEGGTSIVLLNFFFFFF